MDPAAQRDEELMAQVARGDAAPLEPLVRRHAPALLAFLARMAGDAHRAEDLFQEVFLSVWTKRGQYQFPRPFRPWLYAIAVNRCRAVHRLKTPLPGPLLHERPGRCPAPDEQASAGETAVLVSEAIAALPHRQRAVVALRLYQDLPYAQIAEMVGCAEPTVRSHMHHGLAALRESLAGLNQRASR